MALIISLQDIVIFSFYWYHRDMKKTIMMKTAVILSYLGMVTVNALANILPINGLDTGKVSDSFPNLFAPAGLTFSIWGLIYLLLAGFVVYQFVGKKDSKAMNEVRKYFIISSLANMAWIFAWHHLMIPATLFLMSVILFSLIKIADLLRKEKMSMKESLLTKLPFSIYFGWITVATIANVTILLVSLNWNGFGIADYIWTTIILLIGAVIGILRMLKDQDIAYGLVFVWAYFGIWFKHTTTFNGEYQMVIAATIIGVIAFLASILYILKNYKIETESR